MAGTVPCTTGKLLSAARAKLAYYQTKADLWRSDVAAIAAEIVTAGNPAAGTMEAELLEGKHQRLARCRAVLDATDYLAAEVGRHARIFEVLPDQPVNLSPPDVQFYGQ